MTRNRRALVTCCGLVIVGAFFLPWLHTSGLGGSGWTIAVSKLIRCALLIEVPWAEAIPWASWQTEQGVFLSTT